MNKVQFYCFLFHVEEQRDGINKPMPTTFLADGNMKNGVGDFITSIQASWKNSLGLIEESDGNVADKILVRHHYSWFTYLILLLRNNITSKHVVYILIGFKF